MALTFNLDSQIVVKTAAQWAVDATVYSSQRILVTSDEYWGTTDQRKFKISDGVQTWSNLDYPPFLTSANITQVITNGVTDKAPSEDAVFDALALKRSSTYETLLFTGSFSSINLADSTTYYFGTLPSLPPQATASLCRLGFNQNLTITKVILTCSQGTNYSNEAVSVYLRQDNTTDNTITTSLDLSSVGLNSARIFSYSTNISVLSSSYYEVKIVTPAFATNGTNSRWFIQIYGY